MTPKELLASTSLAAFIAERPPSTVVTVSSSSKLDTVLRLFASRDILSAPVIESSPSSNEARCLGFVGVDDVLRAVLSFAGFSSSSSSSPSSPASREEKLRRASERLCSTTVGEIQREGDGRLVFRCSSSRRSGEERIGAAAAAPPPPSPSPCPPSSGETSLLDVVRDGFLLGGEKGEPACHRVAVCDFDDEGDDDDEGDEDETGGNGGGGDQEARAAAPLPPGVSSGSLRVVTIVSQSDVVRFLARHLGKELESGGARGAGGGEPTARDLASAPVAAVAAAMPAALAFAALFQQRARVSAAAIAGTRGELVGSLSASDLRGLLSGGAEGGALRALGLPVGDFVEARASASARRAAAAAAAAADGDDDGDDDGGGEGLAAAAVAAGSCPASFSPPPLLAVGPDTPLSELVRLLAEGGHHRAFVVEEEEEEEEETGGGGEEGKGPRRRRRRRRRATGVVSLGDVLRFVCKD